MKVKLDIEVKTSMSFSEFSENQFIAIDKLPRMDHLVQLSDKVFRFETVPFHVIGLSFVGRGSVEMLQQSCGSINLINSVDAITHNDNCSIEMAVFEKKSNTHMEGYIEVEHPLLNPLTKRLAARAFDKIRKEMIEEFERNLLCPVYKNKIHPG